MIAPKAMARVFICSPFRAADTAESERNIEYAKELTQRAVSEGCAPFTPHLYLPQVLDDSCPTMRELGIKTGLAFLETCTEIRVGARYGITPGMRKEIAYARKRGITVTFYDGCGHL